MKDSLNVLMRVEDTSIVILAKEEEKNIGKVLESVKSFPYKVFVIDGHSKDRTVEVAKKHGAKVFLDSGKGKGSGVKFAINNIKSKVFVFMDADGSHRAEEIPFLLKPILDDKADLVIGSRFLGKSKEFSENFLSFIHLIGNKLSSFFVNLIWKGNITDVQNGFRAIKRSIAKKLELEEDGFAIEQEMVIKCLKNGYRIVEIPSFEEKRLSGFSHINPFTSIPRYIINMIKNL